MRIPADSCPTCCLAAACPEGSLQHPVDAPYKADLAVTYGCNNACAHCYNEPSQPPMASLPKESGTRSSTATRSRRAAPDLHRRRAHPPPRPARDHPLRRQPGHIAGLNTNGRRLADRPFVAHWPRRPQPRADHPRLQSSRAPQRHDRRALVRPDGARHRERPGQPAAHHHQHHPDARATWTTPRKSSTSSTPGLRTFAMNGMIYSGGGFANPDAIPEAKMPALLLRVRDRAGNWACDSSGTRPPNTAACRRWNWTRRQAVQRGRVLDLHRAQRRRLALPVVIRRGRQHPAPTWSQIWQGELFRSFRDRVEDPRGPACPTNAGIAPTCPCAAAAAASSARRAMACRAAASCSG